MPTTTKRRFPVAIAGLCAVGVVAVLLLSGSLLSRSERPTGQLPALPAVAEPLTAELPAERCQPPMLFQTPAEQAAAPPAPPEPPMWAGEEDDPPPRPAPPAELLPTGISFQSLADKLGQTFVTMNAPPAEPGFARHFQEYTENLSTKIQLEGDRSDLSTVRLMFFDRRTQSAEDLRAQNRTFQTFLQAVGADPKISGEVLQFVERVAATGGPPHEQREWTFGANRLVVSLTAGYGSGVIEVRRTQQST